MYARVPLSVRNVEDLLFECGIDMLHETARLWWNRFGPLFAGDIRRQRVSGMHGFRHWRWHHLIDRQTCRERRFAALAEWQALQLTLAIDGRNDRSESGSH